MSAAEPVELFREWYASALACRGIVDASAMALGTADATGRPSVRMVLLKHHDESGFVFYTNLQSPKGRQLKENARAELCFHWAPLKRQVRIYGQVVPVSEYEADQYFKTRPRLSQLGAWASEQSRPMPHRYTLETRVAGVAASFGVTEISRPPHWSGFRVVPEEMEFWTERPFRHHDRCLFVRLEDRWEKRWLFP